MIDNRQSEYDTKKIETLIDSVLNKTIEYEGINRECEISVLLLNNEQIKEINKVYRSIDRATDVLSFPMINYDDASKFKDIKSEDLDMDTGEIVLGDIAISLEKAYEQAIEYGHSFEREITFLTVHGMLHLLGYDHEKEIDRKVMRNKEDNILDLLNIKR